MRISQEAMLKRGRAVVSSFLRANPQFDAPEINVGPIEKRFDGCARYHFDTRSIDIDLYRCASAGLDWSWPCFRTDQTPCGILAHEVGHYIDDLLHLPSGHREWKHVHRFTPHERLGWYEPNPLEAFAEAMRLFITNPDLLWHVAPTRYTYIIDELGLVPRTNRKYITVLKQADAPTRVLNAAIRRAGF